MSLKFEYIAPRRRRPQEANTGDSATSHAVNTYLLSTRPRIIHVGPAGAFDSGLEEHSAKDWPVRWPYVNGDDAETALEDIQPTVHFYGSAGKIQAEFTFLAVHNTRDYWNAPTPDLDELAAKAVEFTWDLEFEATQLDDGDATWASATTLDTVSKSIEMTQWPTYSGGTYRILQTAAYIAESGAYEYGRAFKEGMLGIEDHAFLTRFAFTADVSSATSLTPIRLTLKATPDAGTPGWRAPATLLPHSKANLRLYLIASEYEEVPTVPGGF